MPETRCCVCGNTATKRINRRDFCDVHFETAHHTRTGAWRSVWWAVAAMVAFVLLVFALDAYFKPSFSSSGLIWRGILLAIVPSGIWMAFFYLQDRIEPEPKGYVLGVFALGAILAGAVGIPMVDTVFHVSKWLYADTLTTILGSILVVGFVQEFLKYAAVRYSVYNSAEFDEATDGVIYATAAALGFATVLNVQFVMSNGGVDLGSGAIRIAIFTLAHASFASIAGYFLGRAKFESEPLWWMPLGITLAAVTNGLFFWLRGQLTVSTSSLTGGSNPWFGLVLAAVLAVATTVITSWLVQRNIASALAVKEA